MGGLRQLFGAYRRAVRALMDAIGLSEIAAGVEPAHWNGKGIAYRAFGSRRVDPVWCWPPVRLAAGREGLDDDQARATARAWPGQHMQRVRGNIGLFGPKQRLRDVCYSAAVRG